jgi:hypothetical protein
MIAWRRKGGFGRLFHVGQTGQDALKARKYLQSVALLTPKSGDAFPPARD